MDFPKKTTFLLSLWLGIQGTDWAQDTTNQQMSVEARMAKARTAKADKKAAKAAGTWTVREKATTADYNAPTEKQLRGPNGEVVHMGERGGKYYINKNGNKTYLSSNQ